MFGPWACGGGQSFDDGTDGVNQKKQGKEAPFDGDDSDQQKDPPPSPADTTSDSDVAPRSSPTDVDGFDAGDNPKPAVDATGTEEPSVTVPTNGPHPAADAGSGSVDGGADDDRVDDAAVPEAFDAAPPKRDGTPVGTGSAVECVDTSHVDERQRDDLQVVGTGFQEYDGQVVRILVTHGEPTYGLGEVTIVGGAFEILLPGVLGDYTGIAVHVDTQRNSACDPDAEFIWQMTTGPAPGDTVWEVTPDSLMVFDQVGPCSLNGIFDLEATLVCPSAP